MRRWFKMVLGTVGAIAVALVWAIAAAWMGAPSILITVGAVAKGAASYGHLGQSSS
jgi:uncharacterized membrane protein YccC